MDITAAAIATLISSSVATIVSLVINRNNQVKSLHDQLDTIIKISIEYPYLESPSFTSTWIANMNTDKVEYLRYDNYCTLIFNHMERLCRYYMYDKEKIERHLNVKDWIRLHKDIWLNPSVPFENADGYDEKLKEFLAGYLK